MRLCAFIGPDLIRSALLPIDASWAVPGRLRTSNRRFRYASLVNSGRPPGGILAPSGSGYVEACDTRERVNPGRPRTEQHECTRADRNHHDACTGTAGPTALGAVSPGAS